MIRLAALAWLIVAAPLSAAPVPKEIRTAPTYVGTWQLVTLDPKDATKRTAAGQVWIINSDCDVAFQQALGGAPVKPSERFALDPKTGDVNHTLIGGMQRMLFGKYKLEGDLLTIQLHTGDPSIRPKGIAQEPGCNVWHLQRVEGVK